MDEITIVAKTENLDQIQSFIEDKLTDAGCSMKTLIQISVAVEEIYVNIAHYAYYPGEGEATIRVCVEGSPLQAKIQFEDSGVPFNPLAKEDADTTLSVDERDIGGLGILMVKKSMDDVIYNHCNGKNLLTITKTIK